MFQVYGSWCMTQFVVEDAFYPQINLLEVIFVKVMQMTISYFFSVNENIIVSIWSWLFVINPQRMHQFVLNSCWPITTRLLDWNILLIWINWFGFYDLSLPNKCQIWYQDRNLMIFESSINETLSNTIKIISILYGP